MSVGIILLEVPFLTWAQCIVIVHVPHQKPGFPWFPVQKWPRTQILLGSIWTSVRHRWPLLVWCVYCNAPLHPTKPHTKFLWRSQCITKQTKKKKVIRRFATVLLHFFYSGFWPTKLSYPFQFLCITIVFANALCTWSGDSPYHHLGSESSGCSCHECMVRACARLWHPCHSHSPIPQQEP